VVFIANRFETRPVSSRVGVLPEVFSVADSRSKSTEGSSNNNNNNNEHICIAQNKNPQMR